MATDIILDNPARVWSFVKQRTPVQMVAGMNAIGLERDGEMVAGVIYEGYSKHNIWMHVGAVPGARWMTKDFLRVCFEYPFKQLCVERVSGYVEASNDEARRFDEHLGFKREAVLKHAASDGGDIFIYVMWRKECKWVKQSN